MSTQWSACACVMTTAVRSAGFDVLLQVRERAVAAVHPDDGVAGAHEVAAARAARGRAVAARNTRARSAPRPRLHRFDLRTEEPRARVAGTSSTSPLVTNCTRPRRIAARRDRLVELGAHLERGLLGARDEHDVGTHHVGDRAREQRVVRATEHERVDARPASPARAVARRARAPDRSRRRPARRTRRSPGTPRT